MPRLLSDFVPDVRVRGAYHAPQNVAEDAVRRVVIDLCERAGVWQYEQEFDLQYGVADYPLLTPEGTRVVCVGWVRVGTLRYQAIQNNFSCQCGGMMVTVPNAKTLLISPAPYPGCLTTVRVNIWLAPLQDVCQLPDNLFEEYSDTIADGAAARLMSQPKTEDFNVGMSRQCYSLYQNGVTRAKNKRVMQRTTGPLLMRGGYF